jgi:hypothetical protein
MEKNLRRSGPILLTVLIFFFFGFAIWRSSGESSAVAQSAQLVRTSKTPTPAGPQAPDGAALTAVVAPPGTQLYVAKRGDSITSVARRYLSQTSYLTSGELSEAIRKSNGEPRSVFLKMGQTGAIPGILDAPMV